LINVADRKNHLPSSVQGTGSFVNFCKFILFDPYCYIILINVADRKNHLPSSVQGTGSSVNHV